VTQLARATIVADGRRRAARDRQEVVAVVHVAVRVHAAIARGVDLRGYMVWSLLDNLEWSLGFSKRFGIVHVNFATQQRTPKDSAHYYARVIAGHGAALAEPLERD